MAVDTKNASYRVVTNDILYRIDKAQFIPRDEKNSDYIAYLMWSQNPANITQPRLVPDVPDPESQIVYRLLVQKLKRVINFLKIQFPNAPFNNNFDED